MAENPDRIIGNEIRRVQDDVRRSINDVKQRAIEAKDEFVSDAKEQYESGKRFLTQNIKNQVNSALSQTVGTEIDVEEFAKDIKERADMEAMAQTELEKQPFPSFMFTIALILDVLDIADITGVGYVVMVCVEIIFTIILYFWMKGKVGAIFKGASRAAFRGARLAPGARKRGQSVAQQQLKKFSEKYLERYASRRLLATFVANIIPIIGILASQAFFVFLAWKRQNKLVQIYMASVVKIREILDRVYKMEDAEAAEEEEAGRSAA